MIANLRLLPISSILPIWGDKNERLEMEERKKLEGFPRFHSARFDFEIKS